MNIFNYFYQILNVKLDILVAKNILPAGLDRTRISLEPSRDKAHGDISTNASLVLSKLAGKNSIDLAGDIAESLRGHADIEKVNVAGPGFINIRLRDRSLLSRANDLLSGKSEAIPRTENPIKVVVDYSSPNLAKEIKKKLMGSSLKPHQDATLDGVGGGIQEGSLVYQLKNKNRIGLSFGHISNANLGDKNPGVEIISLSYQVPFN